MHSIKQNLSFFPLGKAFNQGLDEKAENYKEEGVIKLLKDIRDRMVRPIGGNNDDNGDDNDDNRDDNDVNGDDNDDNGDHNDDNGDDNDDNDDNGNDEIADTGSIDLSWMNYLQLYRQIASEVFTRYTRDKASLKLFTLRTFIGNINNECVKNKKDAREEFKTVKKNVKSEALKQIVKDLEQAIFGYNDEKSKELEEAEELNRRFNMLRNKKILEAEELERQFENLKNRRLVKERIDALRKKLKYLNKARRNKSSSSETSNDSGNNGDDEDDENVINLNNISFDDLSNNPNITPEVVEELSKYFLKMANKK